MDEPVMTVETDHFARDIDGLEVSIRTLDWLLAEMKRKYRAAGGPTDPLALQAHIDALRAREEAR